jgi:hypothetical protein
MKIATGSIATTLKLLSLSVALATSVVVSTHSAKAGPLMDWLAGVDEGEDKIQYPERGPLVVPPSLKLPEPKASAAATNPAWPKDPDVERKRKAKEAALVPTDTSTKSKPLTVEEIRAGRKAGAGLVTEYQQERDPSKPLSVQEMQRLNEEAARAAAEAKQIQTTTGRVYLTDPPTVYRKKAVLTPEMEAQSEAAGQPVNGSKPWYQFW